MRLRIVLALAACIVGSGAAVVPLASSAQAAELPCNLGSGGSSASATCYSGESYTWRLVVDCLDRSNPFWPKTVTTLYGAYVTGDGTETLTCPDSLYAEGRIEAR